MTRPITPLLTVDMLCIAQSDDIYHRPTKDDLGLEVLLIKRKNEPFGWALPGGFVEVGETVEQAASRELFEETNVSYQFHIHQMLGVYSDPTRDPRGHTVSVAFKHILSKAEIAGAEAGDDAGELQLVNINDLDTIEIAFDHRKIINDAMQDLTQHLIDQKYL